MIFPQALLDIELVQARHASVDDGDLTVVLPERGDPLPFDAASLTLYQCYESGATPGAIAEDLVDALGLPVQDAQLSSMAFADTLVKSGHLLRTDQVAPQRFRFTFPRLASP